MNHNKKQIQREAVLVALHGDGFVETFAEKNVDVKIVSVPHCPGGEVLAEDVFEQQLPHRYRELFWPNKMRASAMHRPLLPSTMARSNAVRDCLASLNALMENNHPAQEATVWTL